MKTFGYLERGTLIQEGTILQVWKEGTGFSDFYQVALFHRFNDTFSVEVIPLKVEGSPDESYTESDLEYLLKEKMLVIYNQS